jgi:NAD(P)H-dependent flavin oxidoreductase YrpB (nitropropane dioxygenase family)
MQATPFARRLGARLPIFSAPMGGATAGPALTAAVSNAGGCGLLGLGGVPAAAVPDLVAVTRAATKWPFGAGLLLPLLDPAALEACLAADLACLVLFWGDVAPYVARAHARGTRVVAQVGSLAEAEAAARAGADAVIAQGVEAGGHVRGTTALSALLPAVVRALRPLPVLAAGGIANGAGVAAALVAGAQGVVLGTRFLASPEAAASDEYKRRIVAAKPEDTVRTTLFDGGWPDAPHRVLRNRAVREWEAAGSPAPGARPGEGSVIGRIRLGGAIEDVPRYSLVSPLASFEGDHELAALYAGQSCGLVDEIAPAGRIVRELAREADRALARLAPRPGARRAPTRRASRPRAKKRARAKRAAPKRRPRRRGR